MQLKFSRFILIVFLIAALRTPIAQAQDTPTTTATPSPSFTPTPESTTMTFIVFRDNDSLTIYVPQRQEYSSLVGLTLQVTTSTGQQITKRLDNDFAAFLGMPFHDLTQLTPVCFRLVHSGVNVPAPQACQGSTLNLTEQLFAADVFWRDSSSGIDRLVLVLKDNQPLGVCPPGQVMCELMFTLLLPSPTATSTATATATESDLSDQNEVMSPTVAVNNTLPTLIPTPTAFSNIAVTRTPVVFFTPTSLFGATLIPTPTAFYSGAEARTVVNANVRAGDSTAYAVVGQLNSGQIVPIIGISNTGSGWYQVRLPNGVKGWIAPAVIQVLGNQTNLPRVQPSISTDGSTLIPTPTALGGLISTPTSINSSPVAQAVTNANVRAGDSTAYSVVGSLSAGETVPIVGRSSTGSGWWLVRLPNGQEGWVTPSVIRVTGNSSNVPRVQPPPS